MPTKLLHLALASALVSTVAAAPLGCGSLDGHTGTPGALATVQGGLLDPSGYAVPNDVRVAVVWRNVDGSGDSASEDLLLLVRARAGGTGVGGGPGVAVPAAAGPSTGGAAESRFKGGLVVAVVRERGGRQERLAGPFQVRAGDRVRVEVSTDRDRPLAAGLITDDGEWVTLLAPVALEAGTHYSELAARFDESPTRATLLVGDPEDVGRAPVLSLGAAADFVSQQVNRTDAAQVAPAGYSTTATFSALAAGPLAVVRLRVPVGTTTWVEGRRTRRAPLRRL